MRMPLLKAMRRLPSGRQLDAVAGVDLGELAGAGQVGQDRRSRSCRSPRRRSRPAPCCPPWAGTVFSPASTSSIAQPLDVALGDAVRRIEREGDLVVLAGLAELAQLPERLGQAVLGLGVGAELQDRAVGLGGLGPAGGRGLGDRLLGQLALEPGRVAAALRLGLDLGEGHETGRPFGASSAAGRSDARARASRRAVAAGRCVSSTAPPTCQTQAASAGRTRRSAATGAAFQRDDEDAQHGEQARPRQSQRGSRRRAGAAPCERVPQVERRGSAARARRAAGAPSPAARRPRWRSTTA